MEAVHVLAIVDGFDDFLLADVLREGQLDDESIYRRVAVEPVNLLQELCLGDVVLEAEQRALEAAGFAGEHFVANVGLASAVVSDEDGGQVGALASPCHDFLHFFLNLCLDCGSCLFAVD